MRTCIKHRRISNELKTPELLNLPAWMLGPEDAMQIDLLPNLPPSGGYKNIVKAMDVVSRHLFAYTVTDASAANTAKVVIDIMTKHTNLATTLLTDKDPRLFQSWLLKFYKFWESSSDVRRQNTRSPYRS